MIREKGEEYGTTTGRPRRIGWLDLEAVNFSCSLNNISQLAVTKLDVLSGLKELKVCTGYMLKNKKISYSECGHVELFEVRPVYKNLRGWEEDLSGVRQYNKLPLTCRNYLRFIEKFLKIPIKIISVGAERNANIIK